MTSLETMVEDFKKLSVKERLEFTAVILHLTHNDILEVQASVDTQQIASKPARPVFRSREYQIEIAPGVTFSRNEMYDDEGGLR